MKVLHLIDSGGFYGAEIMLLELISEQLKLGIDVCVCSIGDHSIKEKAIEKELRQREYPLHVERMLPGPNIFGAFRILSYAKKEKFDLLHSHGYKANIILGFLPKVLKKIPMISTVHGTTSNKMLSKIYFYEYIDFLALKKMKKVIFVSNEMLKVGNKFSTLKNSSVIRNGISSGELKIYGATEIKKIKKIKSQRTIIGSVGRLSKEKSFETLIKAFGEHVEKNDKNSFLIIVGEGAEEEKLKKLVSDLNIANKVWFPGYVRNASQMIEYFDVYVNSSLTEGTPISLLEAMKAGVPIIASAVGGNSELLGGGRYGWLFDKENFLQLSKLINFVLKGNVDDKALLAKEVFKTNYSSHRMAKEYLQIYRDILIKNAI